MGYYDVMCDVMGDVMCDVMGDVMCDVISLGLDKE